MIKSLLDTDQNDAEQSTVDTNTFVTSGSILDLKLPDEPAESFDPFAITDRHSAGNSTAILSETGSVETQASEPRSYESRIETEYLAPTASETVRMSGLAWSAGIMFFGSVGLMMVFGWLADTVLGSSPWGIVGGIVFGSVIGFVQLVRINTQILKITSSGPRSLLDQAGESVDEPTVFDPWELAATEPINRSLIEESQIDPVPPKMP